MRFRLSRADRQALHMAMILAGVAWRGEVRRGYTQGMLSAFRPVATRLLFLASSRNGRCRCRCRCRVDVVDVGM